MENFSVDDRLHMFDVIATHLEREVPSRITKGQIGKTPCEFQACLPLILFQLVWGWSKSSFRIRSFGEREESPPSLQQCLRGPYKIKNIHNIFSGGQLSVVPTKTNLSHILAAWSAFHSLFTWTQGTMYTKDHRLFSLHCPQISKVRKSDHMVVFFFPTVPSYL